MRTLNVQDNFNIENELNLMQEEGRLDMDGVAGRGLMYWPIKSLNSVFPRSNTYGV